MAQSLSIVELFARRPGQWGLRGDPHLWGRLEGQAEGLSFSDAEAFRQWLVTEINGFWDREGTPIGADMIRIPAFPRMGMSGGLVSIPWWEEKGVPLLVARFEEKRKEA